MPPFHNQSSGQANLAYAFFLHLSIASPPARPVGLFITQVYNSYASARDVLRCLRYCSVMFSMLYSSSKSLKDPSLLT